MTTRGCVCYPTWSAWRAEPEGSSCGFCTKPSAAPAPPLSLPAAAAGPPWAPDGRAGLAVLLALAWGAGCSSFPSLLLRQAAPSPACIFQRFLDVSLPLFPLNFRGGSAVLRSRGGPRMWPSSLSGWKPVHSVSWGRGERLAGRGESPGRAATAGLGLRPPEPFVPTPAGGADRALELLPPPPATPSEAGLGPVPRAACGPSVHGWHGALGGVRGQPGSNGGGPLVCFQVLLSTHQLLQKDNRGQRAGKMGGALVTIR